MTIPQQRQAFIEAFRERREVDPFLSRFFTMREGNRSRTRTVHIDIQREGSPIAIAIKPGKQEALGGDDYYDASAFTTKEFLAAAYNPKTVMNLEDVVLNREFGENPFDVPRFQEAVVNRSMETSVQLMKKIQRAGESQAAQVLQTGAMSLTDAAGAVVYTANFFPKATHFPTAALAWTNTAADAIGDINAIRREIRIDTGLKADLAIFGENAWMNFIANEGVKEYVEFRRAELIEIRPRIDGDGGATYMGDIIIGTARMQAWVYEAHYDNAQTGVATNYMDPDKVTVMSSRARLDRLSSQPAQLLTPDPRLAPFNPGRIANDEFDVMPHLWAPARGDAIHLELGARFLMVPTQIDAFGTLQTV